MTKHYEETAWIAAKPNDVFSFIDDHAAFSAHMTQPSLRMGGGSMHVSTDDGAGRTVGSHIRMQGRAFGVPLALDEVVIDRVEPERKVWETVGEPKLLVVGHYKMSVDVKPESNGSRLVVGIDYDQPKKRAWLGRLFGDMYARWCVRQMKGDVRSHFASSS